ncbi:MAG: type II secretion system F family protein [Armatimonadetes bacterium]|nr:type II secretion system F family protein [Armatimonadota bacterium]PIY43477.1 MAG: secretion system protein [Armatimonadetes bacterium CG_4_10_14_3_um_filter_59_10]
MAVRKQRPIDRFFAEASGGSRDESFMERVIRPVLLKTTGFGGKLMSQSAQNSMRERLMKAGFPGGLQAQQWISLKIVLAGAVPIMLMGVLSVVRWRMGWTSVTALHIGLIGMIGAIVGFISPDFVIRSMSKKRKLYIQRTLPDLIDLMTVSVEAGLGFDAALVRVSTRFKGPLGEEVSRAMQEVSLGRPRIESLREMARRIDVPDVTSFITALVQADQLGVAIGNVLRVQSEQMRERRAQRARETAQKTPVKMMIPLVLFVFPALFVVIMGPACIRGADILKNSSFF